MTSSVMQAETIAPAAQDAIRPFTVNIPEAALADLKRRIAATRWPAKETVSDRSQGVQLARGFGLTRSQVLEALSWGTFYGGTEALDLAQSEAGDLLDQIEHGLLDLTGGRGPTRASTPSAWRRTARPPPSWPRR